MAHSGECVLYANSVNVYKLLQPILISFSLASFMEMHSDYTAAYGPGQPAEAQAQLFVLFYLFIYLKCIKM